MVEIVAIKTLTPAFDSAT